MEEEILNENIIDNDTESNTTPVEENNVQYDEIVNPVVSDQEVITPENVQNEQNENDLLIEYIKSQVSHEIEEQQEGLEENVQGDSNTTTDNNSDVDIYQSLSDSIDLLYQEQLNTNMDIETYLENNTMQSDVEDISLTNQLLIVVFLGILFTALLNFSRRIF